jgi:hypothetical protein
MPNRGSLLQCVIVCSLLSPSLADAACKIPRQFVLNQQNGFQVTLDRIEQNGTSFDGGAKTTGMRGDMSGTLSDKGRLRFTIAWDGGSKGVYTGVVEGGRVKDGRTFDETHPANWSIWTSGDTINCDP